MMETLVHFAQAHETFRRPEVDAIAELGGFTVDFDEYDPNSPFALTTLADEHQARFLARAILVKGFYELWAVGNTYEELHAHLKSRLPSLWKEEYATKTFKFLVDCYQGKRSAAEQTKIVNEFSYLNLRGKVRMANPDLTFRVIEDYATETSATPRRVFLGRLLALGGRLTIDKYDVKKRHYIGNTTMESELSLVTANFAHASPGKLIYDPFAGTGSFMITSAHFGAMTFGSDIDGRSLRGKKGRSVLSNFTTYGLLAGFGDTFVCDITNSPVRAAPGVDKRIFDAIVCDPPYGVREGLKVLGSKDAAKARAIGAVVMNGSLRHTQPDYIPPKRPYSFTRMMDDILEFAAIHLVPGGRLCMWMPTANDDDSGAPPLTIPQHPQLEHKATCIQAFNHWSRQLLTYSRRPLLPTDDAQIEELRRARDGVGMEQARANDLNDFRRKYFEGFKASANADLPGPPTTATAENQNTPPPPPPPIDPESQLTQIESILPHVHISSSLEEDKLPPPPPPPTPATQVGDINGK
ncbi:S-adenosyl-L-methionine-dependent methyltransferase [Peziza echinospora]|nr:S-adenosyl-L-methionine-dependent methyltransferase [Peziza echinospora]